MGKRSPAYLARRRAEGHARREEARAQGICSACFKKPAAEGKTFCDDCRAYQREWRENRKRERLCVRCGIPQEEGEDNATCKVCRSERSRFAKEKRMTDNLAKQQPIDIASRISEIGELALSIVDANTVALPQETRMEAANLADAALAALRLLAQTLGVASAPAPEKPAPKEPPVPLVESEGERALDDLTLAVDDLVSAAEHGLPDAAVALLREAEAAIVKAIALCRAGAQEAA